MTTINATVPNREELILSHLPQAELLARRMHRRCPQVEFDDFMSVATIGLIQAVDRFDASRGLKLKTLAEHRIRGAMLDYLRRLDPLPRNLRQFQKRRDALIASLEASGEHADCPSVAHALGVPLSKYIRWSISIAASATDRMMSA